MSPHPLVRRAQVNGPSPNGSVQAANKRILFFDDRAHTLRGGQQVLVDLMAHASTAGYEPHLATFGEGPLTEAGRAVGATVHLWPVPDELAYYDGHFRQVSKTQLVGAALRSLHLGLDLAPRVTEIDPAAVYLSALRPAVYLWPLAFSARRSLWYAQGNANLGPLSRAASLVPTHLAAVSAPSRACFGLDNVSLLDVATITIGVATDSIMPRSIMPRSINQQTASDITTTDTNAQPSTSTAASTNTANRSDGEDRDNKASHLLKVVCVGEVTPAKGQQRLAAACERLYHRSGVDVELSLVGGVRSPAGERYLSRVFAAAPSIKIIDRGWLSDLSTVYAGHDLLALTSEAEGTPRVFVEALAAGIPVVSTAVGGIGDIFGGQPGVHLVPADAGPDVVAQVMLTAAQGPHDPHLLHAAAASFAPEVMVTQLLGALTGFDRPNPARSKRVLAHLRDLRPRRPDR